MSETSDNLSTASSKATEVPTSEPAKPRWADVADEEEPPAPSEENSAPPDIQGLAIDGSSGLPSETLSDPDESNIQTVTAGDYADAKRFEDLHLSEELLKGLYVEMKFEKPSAIQAKTLPMILSPPYKNLIAQARNGTGKTTCFVLGMLSRVDPKVVGPQALCICPTRELAIQNMEVLLKMGKYTGIKSVLAIPADSANYIPINKRPPITEQVVIGTPGTVLKWITAKKLSLSSMKILVFDEADHMLAESGFRDDSTRTMREIVKRSPNCQVVLFSATFDDAVTAFVDKINKELFVANGDYNKMFVKKEELSLASVKQFKVYCPDELAKVRVIKDKILELGEKVGQTIIFVGSRNCAHMLHTSLVQLGYEVTTIQGALRQEARDKIIKEFKEGLTQVLISTDVLARGFDQSQVNLVVNYDLPSQMNNRSEPDYEVYLHRVGRAGRFGRKGAAFNLLCNEREEMLMQKIERHFNSPTIDVGSWGSDDSFREALKKAGLL